MQITFTISNTKAHRIIDAINGLYPISPDWEPIPYTPGQWAKEKLRRTIIDMVFRWERQVASEVVAREDDLVS